MRDPKIDFYSPTALKSYNLDKTMRYQLNVLGNLDFLLKGIAKMLLILFAEFANIWTAIIVILFIVQFVLICMTLAKCLFL